jgi:hypothetical protein
MAITDDDLVALANRIRPVLQQFGPPPTVLGAVIFIMAHESAQNGRTLDQFVNTVRAVAKPFFEE